MYRRRLHIAGSEELRMYISICVVWACTLCVACESENTAGTERAALGGKQAGGIYHINMLRGNPNALDPALINSKLSDDIALQIYDRLISLDSNLNIIPEFARRWEISEDGLTYTFHVRTDVYFHDNPCFPDGKGRRATARDVAYSLTRCCDPSTGSVQFWAFTGKVAGADEYHAARRRGESAELTGITAIDDTTLVIRLTRAYAPFLYYLVNSLGCVVPYEAVEHYGREYYRNPVGTGAFVFTEWIDDRNIALRRNPHYWQKDKFGNQLPLLDEVYITFLQDDKAQFAEFEGGRLEENFTIPTEFFDKVVDVDARSAQGEYSRYTLQARPAMLSWFLNFLCTKPPFNNVHVRRAFSYAIDREKIVRYVLRGAPYAPADHGITPPVMPGYDIDSISGFIFDPAKAQASLTRAGYPQGTGFPQVTLTVYQEPSLVRVAEAVQNMLEQTLGIQVKIAVLQFAKLMAEAESGRLDFWGTRWYGDYPEAENYLNLFNGELVPTDPDLPSYPNSSRYDNPEYSRLLNMAVGVVDPVERNRLYREAETLLMRDAPTAMLFYEMHYRLLQPYVRDYPLDAMNRVVLKRVWLDDKANMP